MAPKKSANSKKPSGKKTISVMDVSKPGKTTPDASSRPIIVGHKPMVKDTTVSPSADRQDTQSTKDEKQDQAEGEKIKVSRTAPKVIQPPTDMETEKSEETPAEKPKEDPKPTEAEEPTQEKEPTPAPETEENPPESDAANTEETEEPATEEAAAVGAVAGQAPDRQAEAREAEAEQKKQQHLQQLVAEKKYQLPIRTAKRRRRAGWLVLLLVIVILLAAGFYTIRYTNLIDTDAYNLPSWLTGQTDSEPEETSNQADETDSQDTSATPVPDAQDAQREADINAIATQLENYHTINGHYPSLGQLNDPNFRADSLAGLDAEAYQDPSGDSSILSVSSSSDMYGYSTTPTNCDNQTTDCTGFTLTATLSDDTVYQKSSTN